MARSWTGCRQKARALRRNKVARQVIALMHREFAQNRTVAMDRGAMRRHIELIGAPIPDDPVLRAKVIEKREEFIKSACNRLVRLGHLASKTVKRKGKAFQMYALPENREYL